MNGYTMVRMRSDELIGEAERVRLMSGGRPAASLALRPVARVRRAAAGWRRRRAARRAARPGGRGWAPVPGGHRPADGHRAAEGKLVAGEMAGRTR